jgi:sporulation protein YlmC with PRC-barrel domain
MELSENPRAFSELIGTTVVDQTGRRLGQVLEVRAHWQRDGSILLDELMVGRRGLWRRLRGPNADERGIPWETIAEIGTERIVVRR